MFRKLTLRILTLFVLAASISHSLAQEPIKVIHSSQLAQRLQKEAKAEQVLQAILEKRIDFDYQEIALFKLVDDLEKKTSIDIHLDVAALDDVALNSNSTVSLQLKNIRLRTGLTLMLRELDLSYILEKGSLKITTPEEAEKLLQTVFHEVSDLVYYEPVQNPDSEPDYDGLIEILTTSIHPEAWEMYSGPPPGSPIEGGIVFTQSPYIHEGIKNLVAALRKAKALPNSEYDVSPICTSPNYSEVERIQELLQKEIILFEVSNKSLASSLEVLLAKNGIQYKIDLKGLDDIGLTPQTVVDGSWKSQSIKQILQQLLDSLAFEYYFFDDVIMITTKEEAECHTVVKVYPVRDFQIENPRPKDGFGGLYNYNMLLNYQPAVLDYDQLIQIIRGEIELVSWEELGGPGAISPFDISECLVIAQTEAVHQKIEKLLFQIRSQRTRRAIDKPEMLLAGQPITLSYEIGGLFASKKDISLDQQQKALQQVANLIQKEVAPDTWSEKPLYVEVIGDQLVITQLPQIHVKLGQYLIKTGLKRNRSFDHKPLKPWGPSSNDAVTNEGTELKSSE